jgi:hypothetical protein
VFSVILIAGTLAFTIALLHLLRGCPIGDCNGKDTPEFTGNFFMSFSATFFFLVGTLFVPIRC